MNHETMADNKREIDCPRRLSLLSQSHAWRLRSGPCAKLFVHLAGRDIGELDHESNGPSQYVSLRFIL